MTSQRKVGERKLFKLKKWLTLSQAAKHLSILFDEEINEAEVLRLGLDGHLKLSVNIYSTDAKRCLNTIVDLGGLPEGQWEPGELGKRLKAEDEICHLKGIYDLPMIGSERNIVELKCKQLNGDPVQKYYHVVETVVEGQDRQLYLLQQFYHNSPPMDLVNGEFVTKPYLDSGYYVPSIGLPEESELVVRTSALNELEEDLAVKESEGEKQPNEKVELTNMHIIGILLKIINDKELFPSEEAIREQLGREYTGLFGCSESNLARRFAKAKKLLNDSGYS